MLVPSINTNMKNDTMGFFCMKLNIFNYTLSSLLDLAAQRLLHMPGGFAPDALLTVTKLGLSRRVPGGAGVTTYSTRIEAAQKRNPATTKPSISVSAATSGWAALTLPYCSDGTFRNEMSTANGR